MRSILAMLLVFLLSGCWVGNAFYTAKDASQPIPAGQYEEVAQYPEDESTKVEMGRISLGAGGTTLFEGKDELVLVPISGLPNFFIGQKGINGDDRTAPEAMYFLFEKRAGGFRMSMPTCDDQSKAIRPFNIRIEKGMVKTCYFPDAATLEAAMKIYAEKPDNWVELQRIGD